MQGETKHDETLPTHVFTKPATKQINPDTNLQTPATQDPEFNKSNTTTNTRNAPLGSPPLPDEVKTKPQRVFSLALYSQTLGAGKRKARATWRDPEHRKAQAES